MAASLGICALVEILIFSGTPNPVLRLDVDDALTLCSIRDEPAKPSSCRVLGFTGYKLADGTVLRPGNAAVDNLILRQTLDPEVRSHMLSVISQTDGTARACDGLVEDVPSNATQAEASACGKTVVGPDDPTKVHYAPGTDDRGCFETKQSDNNCYDYGTDIATMTFAQPGRGSGVCTRTARPCVKNTCDAVRRGAESDGLVWAGTELPTSLPEEGHYVSLHIWPNANFHWLRMDANMMWSHKPGGSPVRNVDNNGKKINDPAKADVSPWSTHCGYMHVVPSNVTIF